MLRSVMGLQLLSNFRSPLFGMRVIRPFVTPLGKLPELIECWTI